MADAVLGIDALFAQAAQRVAFNCVECSEPVFRKKIGRPPKPPYCRLCSLKFYDRARRAKFASLRPPPTRGMVPRDCVVCGAVFTGRRQTCGPKCHTRTKGVRSAEEWLANAKTRIPYQCEQCEKTFFLKNSSKRAGRFCSRECSFAWQKEGNNRTKHPACLVFFVSCAVCAELFTSNQSAAKYCSDGCRSDRVKRPKITKQCADCGSEITGTAALVRCRSCNRRNARKLQAAKHGRVRKHRERARRYGVEYEPINPIAVFERDGWRCQICRVRTPKRHRGTYKPTAPELDHIVPMAIGGSHTWGNVQASCRACNIAKGGAKPMGQLNLFPRKSSL